MSAYLNKTADPVDFRPSFDATNVAGFVPAEWFQNPDVSAVYDMPSRSPTVPFKYWQRPLADPVVEMTAPEKTAVDVAEAAALESSQKTEAKSLYDLSDGQSDIRWYRNQMQAIIDELNQQNNRAFAGLFISNSAATQALTVSTWHKVENWSDALDARATADSANDQIVTAAAGTYVVSASIAYQITGNTDVLWAVYANGSIMPRLRGRRSSAGGDDGSVTIGPLAIDVATANETIDLRVRTNSGNRTLTVIDAQLFIHREPHLGDKLNSDMKTIVDGLIDAE